MWIPLKHPSFNECTSTLDTLSKGSVGCTHLAVVRQQPAVDHHRLLAEVRRVVDVEHVAQRPALLPGEVPQQVVVAAVDELPAEVHPHAVRRGVRQDAPPWQPGPGVGEGPRTPTRGKLSVTGS